MEWGRGVQIWVCNCPAFQAPAVYACHFGMQEREGEEVDLEGEVKPGGQVLPSSGSGSSSRAGPTTPIHVGSPDCCLLRAVPIND